MSIQITVFAVLKDFLPQTFSFEPKSTTIEKLRMELKGKFPKASAALNVSRFATESEFLEDEEEFLTLDHIYIIPPSSGG